MHVRVPLVRSLCFRSITILFLVQPTLCLKQQAAMSNHQAAMFNHTFKQTSTL